jgi:uncharacterized membrane protein
MGATVLDVLCALEHSRSPEAICVSRAIAIDATSDELYAFWRDFQNLPRFMRHLVSVTVYDETRSHWVAKAPAGRTAEWDAEIKEDVPGRLIAWRTLPDADVVHSGCVRFEPAPGGRGTFVRVELEYRPPGGVLGATVAKLFGEEPEQQIQADLYRLKQLLETGQITTTEGQSAGRAASTSSRYDSELVSG